MGFANKQRARNVSQMQKSILEQGEKGENKMKHTPGPWHCEEVHQDSGRIQIGTPEDFIAEIYQGDTEQKERVLQHFVQY